jgi:hypothetical protein
MAWFQSVRVFAVCVFDQPSECSIRSLSLFRECLVTNNEIIPGERTINLNDNWLQLQVRHAGEDTKCMAAFPILSSAIKEAEGRGVDIIGAGFSLLRAHTDIPIHQGDQNGLLRYHLGVSHCNQRVTLCPCLSSPKTSSRSLRLQLNVPKGAEEKAALLLWSPGRYPRDSPPQKLTWSNGTGFVFDDSNLHMVYNRLSSDRVVLMVDFVRPIELWANESTTWSWANGLLRRALVYLHRHVLRMAVPKDAMIFENQNRHCSASPGCFGGT